jgi:small conductance mechanosensitive channel
MQVTDVIATPASPDESTLPLGKTLEAVGFQAEQALSDLLRGDVTGVVELGSSYLLPASLALLAVFIGYLVAKYVSRIISHPVCRSVDETLGKFVGRVVFYAILISVVGATLSHVGVKMGGLAAVLGAAGFAVGLAFQGTLSNFAAGVLLLVFRPFKVGDMVNAAGVVGKVNEIDLFTTTLDTPDNRRIIVPNSSISGGTIENISFHKHRRIEVLVGVEYAADLQRTRDALQRAVDHLASETVQGPDRGAFVILAGLGSSSVDWKVRMWVNTPEFFRVTELLTNQVKLELDAAGITIPFPQMDVHLHRVDRAQRSNDIRTTIELHRPDSSHHEAVASESTERSILRKRPILRA